MKKTPDEWIKEILEKNPSLTPTEVWEATHKWLNLSYIMEYMENKKDVDADVNMGLHDMMEIKDEENKQEGTEGESIEDTGNRPVSSRKTRRTV